MIVYSVSLVLGFVSCADTTKMNVASAVAFLALIVANRSIACATKMILGLTNR